MLFALLPLLIDFSRAMQLSLPPDTNLPWMPDGRNLWDHIKEFEPVILTGIPRGNWASSQKVLFTYQHTHTCASCCFKLEYQVCTALCHSDVDTLASNSCTSTQLLGHCTCMINSGRIAQKHHSSMSHILTYCMLLSS
jgi:hypothetical protein